MKNSKINRILFSVIVILFINSCSKDTYYNPGITNTSQHGFVAVLDPNDWLPIVAGSDTLVKITPVYPNPLALTIDTLKIPLLVLKDCHLKIYIKKGSNLVKTILDTQIVASELNLIWDTYDDNKKKLTYDFYRMYIEATYQSKTYQSYGDIELVELINK